MKNTTSYALIYGSLAGVLYFLFFVMMYFFIDDPLSDKISPLGLQMIVILFGVWHFKKNNNGYLHFYQGFSIGILANVLAAILSGVLIYLFLILIDITPFENWISNSVSFLLEDRESKKEIMSDETFRKMIHSIENSKPVSVILDRLMAAFWLVFPIGLFAMIMRKIKPE